MVQLAVTHNVIWAWRGASVQIQAAVRFAAQAECATPSARQVTYCRSQCLLLQRQPNSPGETRHTAHCGSAWRAAPISWAATRGTTAVRSARASPRIVFMSGDGRWASTSRRGVRRRYGIKVKSLEVPLGSWLGAETAAERPGCGTSLMVKDAKAPVAMRVRLNTSRPRICCTESQTLVRQRRRVFVAPSTALFSDKRPFRIPSHSRTPPWRVTLAGPGCNARPEIDRKAATSWFSL